MSMPHELDFGKILQSQGATHVIAQDNFGNKLIADFDSNDPNPVNAFKVRTKGPFGSGIERIQPNAIQWYVNNAAGFESLRGLVFSGSGTISGDTAIPNAWFLQAAYVADGNVSYYDSKIGPAWLARSVILPPSAPTTSAGTSAPAPNGNVLDQALNQIGSLTTTVATNAAKVISIEQQLADIVAMFRQLTTKPATTTTTLKPNESLPPKNPTKRGRPRR